jgi:hypothetical protein|tara:strand:+ start:246 stop:368 length:123 start_codon:yes stop_codon:yes gene_type:complete
MIPIGGSKMELPRDDAIPGQQIVVGGSTRKAAHAFAPDRD